MADKDVYLIWAGLIVLSILMWGLILIGVISLLNGR